MAVLNYAEAYSQALAQKYATGMYFGALFTTPNNSRYKIVDAKTIKIPSLKTTGRVDGDRDIIGKFSRNFDNEWETKTLTNHRCWNTLVHPQDVNQTNMVATIANITSVFNAEQKLPEKQKYLVSKINSEWKALGNTAITTALTTDNILTEIDKLAEKLDEANVPVEGRLMYVTPAVKTLLKQAKEINRYLNATESAMSRSINRIDEFTIISVPSDLMKTSYNFTEGATVGAGAKQIKMFVVHPSAILTPESYSFVGMQEPTVLTQGKYAYYEEAFEDVFILNKRANAIYFVEEA